MSQRSTPARPDRSVARRATLALLLLVSGCAGGPASPCVTGGAPTRDVVSIVDHGWHTDLAIPAGLLRGDMARFRTIFPGMTVLVVGFGKRTFMMAPVIDLGDLLVGPFPGDGTLLVAGLTATPDRAYRDGTMVTLTLPPGGADRLSAFVWQSFRLRQGEPARIGPGFFPGSVFYASRIGYSGLYTCNSWIEDALHAAGVGPDASGVVFAGQVIRPALRRSGACSIEIGSGPRATRVGG